MILNMLNNGFKSAVMHIPKVEPLSKVCKKCKQHEDDKNPPENAAWKEHAPNCKANHKGSAPAMETAGARRIFNCSIDLHVLQYTEYFGDGDSKGFDLLKDTYFEDYKANLC